MLKRVLEPEVMDQPELAAAYDAMDHDQVNRQFVEDLRGFASGDDLGGEILDVGVGTARIPIELCRQVPQCSVVGIDLATSMVELGRANIRQADLEGRISLELVDAKSLPYADQRFNVVISNSIVHHIPDPKPMLAEVVRATRSGGVLFFRDLLRPPDDAAVMRLVHAYAASESDEQRRLFDDSLRASLSLHEVRDIVKSLGFDPMSVQTTSDRHWTWANRKR